jgi:hypothetical protein
LSCVSVVLFSWLNMMWYSAVVAAIGTKALNPQVIDDSTFDFLWVLAIICICIGVINGIVTVLRWMSLHFILSIVSLILACLVISSSGRIMGVVRNASFDSQIDRNCMENLGLVHRDQWKAQDFCPSKYLPEKSTCRKQDLVQVWEDYFSKNTNTVASLNPACCF